jgi:hypothetical protein
MLARAGMTPAIEPPRPIGVLPDVEGPTSGETNVKARDAMKLIHRFRELPPDKRPQDPEMNGSGLRFETMEHGGEYPDTMPQALKLVDAEGRSCIYVPITQEGRVVDSLGHSLDAEDDD